MKRRDTSVVMSASDLIRFQGCVHAVALDLRYLNGDVRLTPAADSASAELIQAKGDEHEQDFLQGLLASNQHVCIIDTDNMDFDAAAAATIQALHSGVKYIYQGALAGDGWAGYSDFLERVDLPSKLGHFSYEVIDTKLKQSPDPKHVLQLALYSDLLAQIQGIAPRLAHVVLGNKQRVSLQLSQYACYARVLRRRLEHFIGSPPATKAEPVSACELCRWREHCRAEWDRADSLTLVAGIRKDQRLKLQAAGVKTLSNLAHHSGHIPSLAKGTFEKLKAQAVLQAARRRGGPPTYELRRSEPGQGLAGMPKPDSGDLYFDMEGDPLIEGGLEYLFGVYDEANGKECFRAFWAHDRAEERQTTADVLKFFSDHIDAHPDAHIYHYNHYEVTTLKRLAMAHGVGEARLDRLLRERRFVDLYRVVQQSMICSESGYSIKDLEVFYADKRSEAVKTAGDSIVVYEKWRQTKDPILLDGIKSYNETDCRSTKGLHDWLVTEVRPSALPWAERPASASVEQQKASPLDREQDRADLQARLATIRGPLAGDSAQLLVELAWFHRREDKPQWWAMFDRAERESDDLIDHSDCLSNLAAKSPARADKRSAIRTYAFPAQETKLRFGSNVRIKDGLKPVRIERLDPETREIDLRFGPSVGPPPDSLDLVPGGPLDTAVLQEAIRRVIDDAFSGGNRYEALIALLTRSGPRIKGRSPGAPVLETSQPVVNGTIDVVRRLERTTLPIQGPPGTGKTYVSSQAILTLIREGKRVGVSSNSHSAIDNLLEAVAARAREQNYPLQAIKKISAGDKDADPTIETTTKNGDARLATFSLIGGTPWLFARPEYDQAFDYLFIDEAGQVSLANVIAAGSSAMNIVLVGDPMQLAQPLQGQHPGESGASALSFLLDGRSTLRPEQGIFLNTSRRLHPLLCRYVSDLVYEGRLTSDDGAARQTILLDKVMPPLASAGLRFAPVVHEGNTQSSAEEAAAVKECWSLLIGQSFRDRDGHERVLDASDIVIVTPYNAQVNLLKSVLPPQARIGTVDKFQGQEAAVSLVSMATSSGEDISRNMEFLFSVNRLNVAISRAQALAIVFASPALMEVPCRTVEQMRLVNALCAVAEFGSLYHHPN